jgi:hypothetical protein
MEHRTRMAKRAPHLPYASNGRFADRAREGAIPIPSTRPEV